MDNISLPELHAYPPSDHFVRRGWGFICPCVSEMHKTRYKRGKSATLFVVQDSLQYVTLFKKM